MMSTARRLLIGSVAVAATLGLYVAVTGRLPLVAPSTTGPAPLERPAGPRLPVIVAEAQRQDVAIELSAIGAVEPFETVALRARVDGTIDRVLFKDGDEVKAGDLLFIIDARDVEAQLRQAEATQARDRAQLANARRELDRQTQLAQRDFATRSALDTASTNAQVLENTVKASEAAMDALKVQLTYAQIRAPIDGRTGSVGLTRGNLVRASDAASLVTINRIQPVKIAFALPQREFVRLSQAQAAGPVAVTATPPGATKTAATTEETGSLIFIDNQLDASTGTIALKAEFANAHRVLWPGMFVDVTVRLGVETGVLTVATSAVQQGQKGAYVFVVGPGDIARFRTVAPGRVADGQTVIESGLEAGERVVLEGQLRLADGMPVAPQTRTAEIVR